MSLKNSFRKLKNKPQWVPRPDILLCPNIPRPMHGVAPRVVLGSKWWNQTRQEAYRSTNYHCAACGVPKSQARARQWLEGHELYKVNHTKGRMIYVETVPLCHFCHNYIHDGRLSAMLEKGKASHQKFVAIIKHGDKVLANAGLKRKTLEERENAYTNMRLNNQIAPWQDWRLVVNGGEYPPKFKTEYQWQQAMK